MSAAEPSYRSALLPAWILACPAVCSAYRTEPRIASGQSREDVTAQDLSGTGCLRGGCWSGRSGEVNVPTAPQPDDSTRHCRKQEHFRVQGSALGAAGSLCREGTYQGDIYIYVYTLRRYVLEGKGA